MSTPPTALWGSLIKSGYQVVYAETYDGIPFIFGERPLYTTRGVQAWYPSVPEGSPEFYPTFSYALVINEGDHMSQECNREEGLASGRALDMVFGRQQLADEIVPTPDGGETTLGAALFRRPSLRSVLAEPVTDPNADEFITAEFVDWPVGGGSFYIGREYVRYAAYEERDDGTWAFVGCERGVAGMPHYHTASTASAYRQITDVPVYWRGRLVTRWAHLCGPDGRFLGERWCELGEFCRQDWRGYVRDTPRPTAAGMVLTCLPLIRIAGQEFGAEVSGTLARDSVDGLPYIIAEPADQVSISSETGSGENALVPVWGLGGLGGFFTLNQWCGIASFDASQEFDAVEFTTYPNHLIVRVTEQNTVDPVGPNARVEARAWFLEPGPVPGSRISPDGNDGGFAFKIPWSWSGDRGVYATGWLVASLDPSADFSDAEIGDTGLLALEADGVTEIASYDSVRVHPDGTLTAFRLSARNVLGSGQINAWAGDTKIQVVAGATGDWAACLRTMMTSSGTGERGDYDQLAHGFGLGLPDDWIAVPVPGSGEFAAIDRGVDSDNGEIGKVTAVTVGKTTIKDMLCGVQALYRRCLVQRRQPDGSIQIDLVSTDIADYPGVAAIEASDVLLDGHETPEMMEAPNHVRVVRADTLTQHIPQVTRDAARAQAEGVRSLEIKAPGVADIDVLTKSAELMLLSDGQCAVRMRLAPWVEIDIGNLRVLEHVHPAIWDWTTGTFAPSSVMGRVLALDRYFWDQTQAVTFLLAGQAQERLFLCPCATVEEIVTTTVLRVQRGDATGFSVNDPVIVYDRGNEDATLMHTIITDIAIGEDYDVFTLEDAVPTSVEQLIITFDEYAECDQAQQRLMFVSGDKEWR